jgi:hypothetical protein
MKYQSQHDLIDPDVPSQDTEPEFDGNNSPEEPDDAYVIGENGNSVSFVEVKPGMGKKKGYEHWLKPAAVASMAVFVVLTVWNLSHLMQGPPPPPTPTPFQMKQALYLGVMKVDAFRRVHGVTPETLAEAGLPEEGVYAYKRVNPTRYILSFSGNGSKIEYDSVSPKDQFFGSPGDMLTIGGSR